MSKPKLSKDFLDGVPEMLVLRLLSEREMYGYELVGVIQSSSDQHLNFGEGVIYPQLHSLQKRRLLAIRKKTINGRQRIYYRLTKKGHLQLGEKISHWQQVTRVIQLILDGKSNATNPA